MNEEYAVGWYESDQFPLRELDGFYAPYYFDGEAWWEAPNGPEGGDGWIEVTDLVEHYGPMTRLGKELP